MGLFLEARLAFWVTLGIPTAFLGALLFLPWLGVSINMMSMFAFLIALGIVVDDAIMVGENIHSYREQGHSLREAAVRGAREMAVPITFAILSNIVAFLPLLFLPGFLGMIFAVVPLVVITVFLVSWLEALFILPPTWPTARPGAPPRPGSAPWSACAGGSRGGSRMSPSTASPPSWSAAWTSGCSPSAWPSPCWRWPWPGP